MSQVIKETHVTHEVAEPVVVQPTKYAATAHQQVSYVVYFILGVIEVLLAFRFGLRILGASTASPFVRFIYDLSGILVMPFEGIFSRTVAPGVEASSVFEPSILVAMIVYGVMAWGIIKLVQLLSGEQQVS